MKWLMVLGVLAAAAVAARGEIVILDDGTRIEGHISKTPDGWQITTSDGKTVLVPQKNVASIEVGGPSSRPAAAAEALASLRRAVEHSTDLAAIINRYEDFIARNTEPDVRQQAEEDLALWRQRQDQGLRKFGNDWITPQEQQQRQQLGRREAAQAADLMRQNRNTEADPLLQRALADDPENAAAFYLQGVLRYKQDRLVDAKTAFEAANGSAPDHAPTLNNLAVICWRQKSFVAAMGFYDQAMNASPQLRQVLDNVAEALHVLPAETRDAPVCRKAVDDFRAQDAALQSAMARQNLFRWGATWVNSQQMRMLRAAQAKIQQQLDDLSHQSDAIDQKIAQIDGDIDRNSREMRDLPANGYIMDANGTMVQQSMPPRYYDLQRDNEKLKQDKLALQGQQAQLRQQADKVRQQERQLPVVQFTGQQQIFGADAAPLRESPTTLPDASIDSSTTRPIGG